MAKGHRLDLTPIQKHRGEWFRRIHVPWYLHGTPRHFQEYHGTFAKNIVCDIIYHVCGHVLQ